MTPTLLGADAVEQQALPGMTGAQAAAQPLCNTVWQTLTQLHVVLLRQGSSEKQNSGRGDAEGRGGREGRGGGKGRGGEKSSFFNTENLFDIY